MHQVLSRAERSTNQRQSQPTLKESVSVINHQPTAGRFLSHIFKLHLFSIGNKVLETVVWSHRSCTLINRFFMKPAISILYPF
jgi:hypothetical protein